VVPGSFDPPTLGHLDVLARAAGLFDEVVVAVMGNPAKAAHWPPPERVAALEEALAGMHFAERVLVRAIGHGLLADLARDLGASAVVTGVRTAADVDHETPMAIMNRSLAGVETVLLVADPRWAHVSSSLVREVAGLGGDVTPFVPGAVARRLGDGAATG
jgi:pantetheine-phosphate adenylyltransferase